VPTCGIMFLKPLYHIDSKYTIIQPTIRRLAIREEIDTSDQVCLISRLTAAAKMAEV
jgi:hypothetical protein